MNKLLALIKSIEVLPILSTLSYTLPIYTIRNKNIWPFLFLIFIFSALHHLLPENQILRTLDWVTAFILIILIMNKVSTLQPFVWLCLFIGLNLWLASIFSFYYLGNKFLYEILHSSWHVLSAFILYQTF
jgi:hypothetical protein